MAAAGMTPDDWQRDLLTGDWKQGGRALLVCSRQSGKTTSVAALALEAALSGSDRTILVLAPARRQSKIFLRRALSLYVESLPEVGIEKKSELRLLFENGSRIVALPGKEKTVRGYTASMVICDEAAGVPDDLYQAIDPMLAVTGGPLVALSTPRGQRGWFYEAWAGSGDWLRVRVDAYDCPRLSDEFLERKRQELGEWEFNREFLCRFQDTEDQLFATEHIESSLTTEVGALFERDDDTGEYLSDTEPLFSDT